MKNKGFTLIELLAVIVILAIIALIATPIILGIINNAKQESDERSVGLYANAIQNSVAHYQLNSTKLNKAVEGTFKLTDGSKISNGDIELDVDYDGNVKCDLIEIYSDGQIYLEGCSVNNSEKKLNYGTNRVGNDEKSVELYATAIQNAAARYQSDSDNLDKLVKRPFKPTDGNKIYNGYIEFEVDYNGNVKCDLIKIYSDGQVYLGGCSVNNSSNKLNYGTLIVNQKYKPQYYFSSKISGTVNETASPTNPTNVPSSNQKFYLGYDVEGNKISTVYACFKINEIEYCLKGNDSNVFDTNRNVMEEAYVDLLYEAYCIFGTDEYKCTYDDLDVRVNSSGEVYVNNNCGVDSNGNFSC